MLATAARRLGQFVIVGFDGYTIPAEVRSLARQFDLGGVIFFARNVEAPEQVADLAHDAARLARDLPLWVCIDQEGGRVARLREPFTEWPPMATLGRAGDEALAQRFGEALAAELAAVGISFDCAPVLDVLTNAANPAIGDRAFSGDAEVVARLGVAVIGALQARGLAACAKHFPGHGDTSVDSHHTLPVVEHPPERLRAVDFVPFRKAIEADVAAIMTSHLLVPAFDEERPASLSRAIVHGVLREELGFDGLVVTDDIEMRGCSTRYTVEEATVEAVAAGADLVLLCWPHYDRHAAALEALVHAVESERVPFKQVEDSLSRQRRMKERFLASPRSPLNPRWRPPSGADLRAAIGTGRHRAVADEMAQYR
jgi:beta-N-acetylhexosaminidase